MQKKQLSNEIYVLNVGSGYVLNPKRANTAVPQNGRTLSTRKPKPARRKLTAAQNAAVIKQAVKTAVQSAIGKYNLDELLEIVNREQEPEAETAVMLPMPSIFGNAAGAETAVSAGQTQGNGRDLAVMPMPSVFAARNSIPWLRRNAKPTSWANGRRHKRGKIPA